MTKRILSSLALLLLASLPAFGQGACYPAGVVLLDTGRPANGASVRVCAAGSTGTPCTPAASLFTDPTLGTPLGGSPTVITDAHGNFGFCAAAGLNYDLQISGSGITPLSIKNLPLPAVSPVVANSLLSSSASPATVGLVKLASGDCLDWRNNANSGNIQLCKTTADALDVTAFSSVLTGNVTVNPSSPTTGAALTVGGTSATTGGMSVFVGALGSATERAAIYPADGSSAALRVGSLSVRAVSGGFLTGAESFGISSTGVVTGAKLTSPVMNTGISQGSGLKHQRIASCTTAATTGALCTTTLTWTSAFPDTSYTVSCQVRGLNAIGHIGQQGVIAASVALTLVADTATATSGEFDCIAIHD